MLEELPDLLTPATRQDAIAALWHGWLAFNGTPPPSKDALWIVAAHWGLETGWGASMHNWNFGNVKSKEGDGYDYQYYGCGEEVPLATALAWQEKDPGLVKIRKLYANNKVQMASVWLDPPHWGSRFRAFHTIEEGALDHVTLLARRFPVAWRAALAKDVIGFAVALRNAGYYTADVGQYMRGLQGCFRLASLAPVDYASLPIMLEEAKEGLLNLVSRSIQGSYDDALQDFDKTET